MSLMALNAAWRVRGLEPIERILLLLLGDIADDQVHANPDISWLAAQAEITPTKTLETLRDLQSLGLLTELKRGGYVLHLTPKQETREP